jgi:hypothetical protein
MAGKTPSVPGNKAIRNMTELQIEIKGQRSEFGKSGMAIDDVMVRPCVDYGKQQYADAFVKFQAKYQSFLMEMINILLLCDSISACVPCI